MGLGKEQRCCWRTLCRAAGDVEPPAAWQNRGQQPSKWSSGQRPATADTGEGPSGCHLSPQRLLTGRLTGRWPGATHLIRSLRKEIASLCVMSLPACVPFACRYQYIRFLVPSRSSHLDSQSTLTTASAFSGTEWTLCDAGLGAFHQSTLYSDKKTSTKACLPDKNATFSSAPLATACWIPLGFPNVPSLGTFQLADMRRRALLTAQQGSREPDVPCFGAVAPCAAPRPLHHSQHPTFAPLPGAVCSDSLSMLVSSQGFDFVPNR